MVLHHFFLPREGFAALFASKFHVKVGTLDMTCQISVLDHFYAEPPWTDHSRTLLTIVPMCPEVQSNGPRIPFNGNYTHGIV